MTKTMFRIPQALGTVAALCLTIGNGAMAQTFPTKPIRIVVPFPAGGPSNFAVRLVTQHLPDFLGRSVIIDNRPGAGGTVGGEIVAKSPRDGYTLLIVNLGVMLTPYMTSGKLSYDPVRDFAPIANLIGGPQWLMIHPSVPVHNMRELIALTKARPGQLTYGSAGVGQ